MRLARVLVAVVIGAVLGLAGCTGDDDPKVLPSASGSTTSPTATKSQTSPPTTEPTPTTTLVLPDEHVPEVDQFVQEFFAAYNAAQDSGDFTAFDAMYLPQCTGCIEMRDELESWLADGGTVEGADWVILQQSSTGIADNFAATVIAYRTAGSITTEAAPNDLPVAQTSARQLNMFLLASPMLALADLASVEA